ncbi:MAG: acetoin utilization protein AcuC [Anaerolineae bacterium]
MQRAALIASETLWAGGHPPDHPLRPERLRDTWEMLHAYRAFEGSHTQIVPPRMATFEELATVHTERYLDAVRRLSNGDHTVKGSRFGFGSGDNPVFSGMWESEGLKVGAALVGAELLLCGAADVVFSFAGGLHHAGRNYASGFCVFGDGAAAIHKLVAAGWRVAYIDIDAHHGDGVQNAFYEDDRVLTISFHESGRYLFPGTGFTRDLGRGRGEGYSVNVPLQPYTDDAVFLWAFEQVVPPLVERFQPDVVVAQLGVDAHWRDPLTHLALTTHGLEALFKGIQQLGYPWLAVGGGGYDRRVVPRAWTLAWGVMSKQTFDDQLPAAVADGHDPPLLRDEATVMMPSQVREEIMAATIATVKELKAALKF